LHAPSGGRYHHFGTVGATTTFYSTAPAFAYVLLDSACRSTLKKWRCLACGYVYDEAEGWPEDGIPAGTRWEDIPAGWCCPECGARKEDFEMVEI
jgi:rubredoxin